MKQKKDKKELLFLTLMTLSVVLFLLDVILMALSIIDIGLFLGLLIIAVTMFTIMCVLYVKYLKEKRKLLANNKNIQALLDEENLIKLYGMAGIPLIRDDNGKIKDVFELLMIEKQFDPSGKRIRSIYELLGIVPRFTHDGKEIPTVLSIKNRVKKFIKPANKTGALKRKLSDTESEELLIKQMLQQKLQESIQKGDTKKADAIKKIITEKKKDTKKKPKSKPSQIKLSKPGTGAKSGSVKASKYKGEKGFMDALQKIMDESGKTPTRDEFTSGSPKEDKKKQDGYNGLFDLDKKSEIKQDREKVIVIVEPTEVYGEYLGTRKNDDIVDLYNTYRRNDNQQYRRPTELNLPTPETLTTIRKEDDEKTAPEKPISTNDNKSQISRLNNERGPVINTNLGERDLTYVDTGSRNDLLYMSSQDESNRANENKKPNGTHMERSF